MSAETEGDLQEFLSSLHDAFVASSAPPHVLAFMDALFGKLAQPVAASDIQPLRPGVLKHLPAALEPARQATPQLARLNLAHNAHNFTFGLLPICYLAK